VLADVLGADLVMVTPLKELRYGAAILAGVGCGAWPDVEAACSNLIKIVERVSPEEKRVVLYGLMHDQYKELYPALKPSFNRLASP